MNSVNKTYRFYLTLPNEGRVQVFPCNNQIQFCWRWNEDLCAWRYELDTTLIFTDHKDSPHKTFTALYDLEQQCGVCYRIPIEIEQYCDGWELHWEGYLPWRSGTWNMSRCKVEIKPRTVDSFSCILDNWKKKYNLLEVEDKVVIKTIKGELEFLEWNFPAPSAPSGIGWTLISSCFTDYALEANTYENIYARECIAGPAIPVGSGWEFDAMTGNYYRPLPIQQGDQTIEISAEPSPVGGILQQVTKYTVENKIIDLNIDNAVTLQDAIEFMIPDCEVCSDFLGINPIGDVPNNLPYQCAAVELQNVVLVQASDVIRASAENNATKFEKCFYDFWVDFKSRFKLEMFMTRQTIALE